MSARSSEALLRDLVRDLTPVRRIPRLRVAGAGVLAAWAASAAAYAALGGPPPQLGGAWAHPAYTAVFVGLGLMALGGLAAALAGAVPGRERAARGGAALAAVGLGTALAALGLAVAAGGAALRLPLAASWTCAARAVVVGALPALAACVFLARAFERRPFVGAALASVAGVSLGAALVHAGCVQGGPVHVALGHLGVPLVAALALALPLAAALRHRSQR